MVASFNLSINASSMPAYMQTMNTYSNGWFGNIIPFLAFFLIMGLFTRTNLEPKQSLLFASIVGLTVSLFLRAMNSVSDIVLVLFILLTVINVYILVRDS